MTFRMIVLFFAVLSLNAVSVSAAGLGQDGYKGESVSPSVAKVTLKGRLAFEESWGCESPVPGQLVDWKTCHEFKHRFYGAGSNVGKPVLDNIAPYEIFVGGTHQLYPVLRPFNSQIIVGYFRQLPDATLQSCGVPKTIQTDSDGYFEVDLQACGAGQKTYLTLEARLAYQFKGMNKVGGVVATWPKLEGETEINKDNFVDLLATKLAAWDLNAQPQFTLGQTAAFKLDDGKTNQTPLFRFFASFSETPAVDLGTLVFLGSQATQDGYFNYVRQVLSGYQNVLELHRRLRNEFQSTFGADLYLNQMYVWDQKTKDSNQLSLLFPDSGIYTVNFDATWAYAGLGGVSLFGPYPEKFGDDPMDTFWLTGQTSTIAHEFGHSVHAAFASSSFIHDYSFASNYRRPNPLPSSYAPPAPFKTLDEFKKAMKDTPAEYPNPVYDVGHSYGQYEEFGTSFTEGIASTLGQFLLSKCGAWDDYYRPWGGAIGGVQSEFDSDFLLNAFNPDKTCDGSDGCSYHNFRYHMLARGIKEGSDAWKNRLYQLNELSKVVYSMGETAVRVTGNNEARWSQFGCDLLESDINNTSDELNVKGQYVADTTYIVGEILDGAVSDIDTLINGYKRTWSNTGLKETMKIGFAPLLKAMANFAKAKPGVDLDPQGSAQAVSQPAMGHSYNVLRLSTHSSPLSQLSFGKYLVSQGLGTSDQLATLLRSNFIDTGELYVPNYVSNPSPPLDLTHSVINSYDEEIDWNSKKTFFYYYLEGVSNAKPQLKVHARGPVYKYSNCRIRFRFTDVATGTQIEKDIKKNKTGEADWAQSLGVGVWVWNAKQVCDNGKESELTELPTYKITSAGKPQHLTVKHVPFCFYYLTPPVAPVMGTPVQLKLESDNVEFSFNAQSFSCAGGDLGFEFEFTDPVMTDLPVNNAKTLVKLDPVKPPNLEYSFWITASVKRKFVRPLPIQMMNSKGNQALVRARAFMIDPASGDKVYGDWSSYSGVTIPPYQSPAVSPKPDSRFDFGSNKFGFGPSRLDLKAIEDIQKRLIPWPIPTPLPTGDGGDPSPMDRRKPF